MRNLRTSATELQQRLTYFAGGTDDKESKQGTNGEISTLKKLWQVEGHTEKFLKRRSGAAPQEPPI